MRCPFASMKDCCKAKCALFDAENEDLWLHK